MILLGRDGLKSSRMSRLKEALAKMKLQRRLLRKIEDAILNDRHGRIPVNGSGLSKRTFVVTSRGDWHSF